MLDLSIESVTSRLTLINVKEELDFEMKRLRQFGEANKLLSARMPAIEKRIGKIECSEKRD